MAIGFYRRWLLERKFKRTLKKGDIQKAAVVYLYFLDLLEDESVNNFKIKHASFIKSISEMTNYLNVLKEAYLIANTEGRQAAEAIKQKIGELLSSEDFTTFLQEEKKNPFYLQRKLNKLELRAAQLNAIDLIEKDNQMIEKEIGLLESLVVLLKSLKPSEPQTHEQTRVVPVSPRPKALFHVSPVKAVRQKLVKGHQDKVDKRIQTYESRLALLKRAKNGREKNKAADEAAQKHTEVMKQYSQGDIAKNRFQQILDAIPEKRSRFFFYKKVPRGSFQPESFISCLTEINNSVVNLESNANDRNDALYQTLLYLFRQQSTASLKKMIKKFDHPEFKNLFFALDYYAGMSGDSTKTNMAQLGFKNTDGTEEQRPLFELQTLTANFISAFHEVLGERNIKYINHFQGVVINNQKQIDPVIQDFIWTYAMKQLHASQVDKALQESDENGFVRIEIADPEPMVLDRFVPAQ